MVEGYVAFFHKQIVCIYHSTDCNFHFSSILKGVKVAFACKIVITRDFFFEGGVFYYYNTQAYPPLLSF